MIKKPQLNVTTPSSTAQAAGIGGVLAGVPIGSYLGGITAGMMNLHWPESYEAMQSVTDMPSAISGLYTAVIAFLFAWQKKENVYQVIRRNP